MTTPPVFVVIPSWNLKDDVIGCIDSALRSSYPAVHIVVVDNGSTDGTAEALTARYGDAIQVIGLSQNSGFARAVNQGLESALAAGAHWVLVLNNDTIIEARMIERLVDSFARSQTVGIAGPIIYFAEPSDTIWRVGDRSLWGPPLTWRVSPGRSAAHPLKVDYVTGCAMLIRREVIEAIGGFDEDYHTYFEDADFCQRARLAGFEIVAVPGAEMWHKVSLSTRQQVPSRVYAQDRGRVIFLKRHSPWLLRPLAHLWIWARLILDSGRYLWRGESDLMRAAVRGTFAGYTFRKGAP